MQSAVGQLGISGLSVPLAGPRQRLIFQHKASSKDQFDAYIKNRDESYTSLSQVRRSYVHTLLSKAGVSVPESFDLNPAQRTLALAQIANRASVFEIAQRQSLPVHPTQEITFEKINSLTDPKQTARTIVQKVPLGMRSQQPKRPSYDTTLRAFYLQTDSDGKPLYSQTVTFEGTDARVALPVVQLDTYEVHPLTKTVATSRAKTNEHISLEMLEYIDAALFEAIYGGKRQRKLPHELA